MMKVCQDGAVTSGIPGPASEFVRATVAAVDQAADGRVLGDLLRALLEDTHPEGFDSDDVAVVTGRCYAAAVAWLPPGRVDVSTLLVVLAGALGIHPYADAEQLRDPSPDRDDANYRPGTDGGRCSAPACAGRPAQANQPGAG
jgi:hypothetical protein